MSETVAEYGDAPEERARELTETGKSVRYTGRPIMTIIVEALEAEEQRQSE